MEPGVVSFFSKIKMYMFPVTHGRIDILFCKTFVGNIVQTFSLSYNVCGIIFRFRLYDPNPEVRKMILAAHLHAKHH